MTVGERIKKIRLEKGMTQKELAEKCGIDSANLRKYEAGKQNPKFGTIEKIAEALNVPATDLLNYQIKKDPNAKTFEEMTPEEQKKTIQDLSKKMESFLKELGESVEELDTVNRELLLSYYDLLNETGKQEVLKRIAELARLDEYKTPDEE